MFAAKLFFVLTLFLIHGLALAYDCSGTNRPELQRYAGYSSRGQGHLRNDVKVLQRALNAEGSYSLSVDGYFGYQTYTTVRRWQSRSNLKVDGIVGPETWGSLCDGSDSGNGSSNQGAADPFQCSYGSWPARTYTDQIVKPAYNSGGKTYHELAVETGLARNVHPALIATHMVLESSMGLNPKVDQCRAVGKSILTGCMWYPSCSKNCQCSGSAVFSDEKQVQCTADTDLRASSFQGPYSKCRPYKNDSDKKWKCILCTYQGNYAKDIKTDDSDSRYFTAHGTCKYAEDFKNLYCDWQAYFAYTEGI